MAIRTVFCADQQLEWPPEREDENPTTRETIFQVCSVVQRVRNSHCQQKIFHILVFVHCISFSGLGSFNLYANPVQSPGVPPNDISERTPSGGTRYEELTGLATKIFARTVVINNALRN